MQMLVIYYRDGSRQVVKPRQEAERTQDRVKIKGQQPKMSSNFCGDWHGLVQAITGGNYLKYEVL